MNRLIYSLILVLLASGLLGCRQPVTNPPSRQGLFNFNQQGAYSPSGNQYANNIPNIDIQSGADNGQMARLNEINQQVQSFDSDNQQLHTELSSLKQQLQLASDYNQQLRQQLADTSSQYQQLQTQWASADQQLRVNQAQLQQLQNNIPTQQANFGGSGTPSQLPGATIRANNSLLQKLQRIQIPGGNVRMDGDVIRIEIPSNNLFVVGTYQIQASQVATLQNLAGTIRREFPQQIIGIEGHWDGTPLTPGTGTVHQMTATQALALFGELNRLGLPERQMFTMAMGNNRQRHPGNAPGNPNRRIEIVIYPETF